MTAPNFLQKGVFALVAEAQKTGSVTLIPRGIEALGSGGLRASIYDVTNGRGEIICRRATLDRCLGTLAARNKRS